MPDALARHWRRWFCALRPARWRRPPYPDKPITMIVAYGAGGSTGVTARMLAPYIERYLGGARIVILNRPGTDGEIGFAAELTQLDGEFRSLWTEMPCK
ncbi:hypothetical protein [Azospirillum palustre]